MSNPSEIKAALDEIKAKLELIRVENGFNHTPAIRRGWLQHLFQGRHRQPATFPVIAYRPELSTPSRTAPGNTHVTDGITVVFDCAVSVKDSAEPVDELLDLLKDLRRSLVFDPDYPKLKASNLQLLDCPFDVPEAGDDYAFFSQKIRFEVSEQYA